MKIFLKIGFVLLVCLFCSLPESYGADLEGDIAPLHDRGEGGTSLRQNAMPALVLEGRPERSGESGSPVICQHKDEGLVRVGVSSSLAVIIFKPKGPDSDDATVGYAFLPSADDSIGCSLGLLDNSVCAQIKKYSHVLLEFLLKKEDFFVEGQWPVNQFYIEKAIRAIEADRLKNNQYIMEIGETRASPRDNKFNTFSYVHYVLRQYCQFEGLGVQEERYIDNRFSLRESLKTARPYTGVAPVEVQEMRLGTIMGWLYKLMARSPNNNDERNGSDQNDLSQGERYVHY